jgi:AcrR family transcriptional regulator
MTGTGPPPPQPHQPGPPPQAHQPGPPPQPHQPGPVPPEPRRLGRRGGDSRTREAILDAARRSFASRGYDTTTIRAVAAAAGVNPALVHHFYGTKEGLFAAAMNLPVRPSEMLAGALDAARDRFGDAFSAHLGEILIGTMLRAWDLPEVRTAFVGLLRSAATTEQGGTMLREFVASTILASLVRAAGLRDDAEGRYRAALVASQVVGLGFTRYLLRLEPIASAPVEDLVAAIGPAAQRYLTGDLAAPTP